MAKKIMIVDDDEDMVEIISMVMDKEGYEVVTALSGEKCLEMAPVEKPDLIFLDIMMPGLDGWRVLERLRQDESTKDIPVAALTAKSQSIDKMIGLHFMKFDDYITKPFGRKQLLGAVAKALGGKERV